MTDENRPLVIQDILKMNHKTAEVKLYPLQRFDSGRLFAAGNAVYELYEDPKVDGKTPVYAERLYLVVLWWAALRPQRAGVDHTRWDVSANFAVRGSDGRKLRVIDENSPVNSTGMSDFEISSALASFFESADQYETDVRLYLENTVPDG